MIQHDPSEPRIIKGKYNVLKVVIETGESLSDKIKLGHGSVMGLYVNKYSGILKFYGSPIEIGVNESATEHGYAIIRKPNDIIGDPYTEMATGVYEYIPVDYSVFGGPNWIRIELEAAATEDIEIFIQTYDL